MDTKHTPHTPGPWRNRGGDIIADTRTYTCCAQPVVGAEYMGQQEILCCGCPEVDGCEEDVIARITFERDISLIEAGPELLVAAKSALNYIENTESELGIKLPSGDLLRAAIAKATGATHASE